MVVWIFSSVSICVTSCSAFAPPRMADFSRLPRSPRTFSWSCLRSAMASDGRDAAFFDDLLLLFFVAMSPPGTGELTSRADLRERHDGARHRLADLAENVLRRDAQLAMARRAFEQILGRFFIEQARVDGAVVQFAEGEQRRQRDAAVAAFERAVDEKREEERRD